jgi:hypothetical protein
MEWNGEQEFSDSTEVYEQPEYRAWKQLNEMICHQINQMVVHHIDIIPTIHLSKWSLRLYTPSLSCKPAATPTMEDTFRPNYKLEPIVDIKSDDAAATVSGSNGRNSTTTKGTIPLNVMEDAKIVASIIAEYGDVIGDEVEDEVFIYRTIDLWRQSRCQAATTLPTYKQTSSTEDDGNNHDRNDDDKEGEGDEAEAEPLPKSIMGIDDDMCDYLATLWMNQSSLEPRSVRVEPYQVTYASLQA